VAIFGKVDVINIFATLNKTYKTKTGKTLISLPSLPPFPSQPKG